MSRRTETAAAFFSRPHISHRGNQTNLVAPPPVIPRSPELGQKLRKWSTCMMLIYISLTERWCWNRYDPRVQGEKCVKLASTPLFPSLVESLFGALCLLKDLFVVCGRAIFLTALENKLTECERINKKSLCVDDVNKYECVFRPSLWQPIECYFLFDVLLKRPRVSRTAACLFFSLHCANLLLVLCVVKIIISLEQAFCLSCVLQTYTIFMAVKRRQQSIKMTLGGACEHWRSLNFIYGPPLSIREILLCSLGARIFPFWSNFLGKV